MDIPDGMSYGDARRYYYGETGGGVVAANSPAYLRAAEAAAAARAAQAAAEVGAEAEQASRPPGLSATAAVAASVAAAEGLGSTPTETPTPIGVVSAARTEAAMGRALAKIQQAMGAHRDVKAMCLASPMAPAADICDAADTADELYVAGVRYLLTALAGCAGDVMKHAALRRHMDASMTNERKLALLVREAVGYELGSALDLVAEATGGQTDTKREASGGAGAAAAPPDLAAAATAAALPPEPVKVEPDMELRRRAAAELLRTERAFVSHLATFCRVMVQPLRHDVPGALDLAEDEHDALFGPIEQLWPLHSAFLDLLEPVLRDWTPMTMASELLLRFAPHWRMHAAYVHALWRAKALLVQVRRERPDVAVFLATAAGAPGALSIERYLVLPAQRMAEYELLVRELVRRTPSMHPDAAPLAECLAAIHRIAAASQAVLGKHENQVFVAEAAMRFHPPLLELLEPHRTILREGTLVKISRHGLKATYRFFLFCDKVVYGSAHKSASGKLQHHTSLALVGYEDAGKPHAFRILGAKGDKSVLVCAPSAREKTGWLEDLARAVSGLRDDDGAADTAVKITASGRLGDSIGEAAAVTAELKRFCSNCRAKLTWWTGRRRCGMCGEAVCRSCASRRVKVKGKEDGGRVIVCDECALKVEPAGSTAGSTTVRPFAPARVRGAAPRAEPPPAAARPAAARQRALLPPPPPPGSGRSEAPVAASAASALVAAFDFEGEGDGEVPVMKGQTVTPTGRSDGGWIEVRTESGRVGFVPENRMVAEDRTTPSA